AKSNLSSSVPTFALPDLTQKILGKIPFFIATFGIFLGGMSYLTRRRNQICKEEQEKDEKK
ncbi:MAG: hypothetical protein N2445_05910, partial [Acidobacteria bacterium]|nr:hypothetical protein [Acidobacteriota bacterium]